MTKTQSLLIERLEGKHGQGSAKQGWYKYQNAIQLQKLNEGDQAMKLAEKYPERFKVVCLAWRLVRLEKIA